MPELIKKYFPLLTEDQLDKLTRLKGIYENWNSMINVISRKDMDNFFVHHVLHSLSIAKVFRFPDGSSVLDVGTGGGFPGIPLAIVFPNVQFSLIDSIAKKIKVVSEVASEAGLKNVIPLRRRVEEETGRYNFIISRAVMDFDDLVKFTSKNIKTGKTVSPGNGIICLKGGDLSDELKSYSTKVSIWNISDFFEEPFFETKKILYLPS
jgi:16S rRNA (guanine527-N7)-methyltransferase